MHGVSFKSSTMLKIPNRSLLIPLFAIIYFLSSCSPAQSKASKIDGFPKRILWAWERPENLEFLDNNKYGVAFLAQTLDLKESGFDILPRRQPLKVLPDTKLIAVTRIESPRTGNPNLSDEQVKNITTAIEKTLELKNVSAIQIDFDAKVSEREFYKKLLLILKERLPKETPLSITALASFCIGDKWLEGLPVDEVVPMIFRMGTDDKKIKDFLANGGDFSGQVCKDSYGISIDEPLTKMPDTSRRIYIFNPHSWTPDDVHSLKLD